MTPGKYALSIYRGDTCRWQVKVWADDARSQPFDLSGMLARAEIRDKPAGSKVCCMNCRITLPNIVDLELTPTMSRTLPARGVWDLRIVNTDNQAIGTILSGNVTVTADVTGSSAVPMQPMPNG